MPLTPANRRTRSQGVSAMDLVHDVLVGFSKSAGLFYLIAMAIVALAYACWPANRDRFDKAARDIVEDEDKPWQ